MAKDTIGIDISKDRIDAFWHSRSEERSLPNSDDGFRSLSSWLEGQGDVLIVFEATGAYHRGLERYLGQAGRSFNPKHARRFGWSCAHDAAIRQMARQGADYRWPSIYPAGDLYACSRRNPFQP